MEPNVQHGTPTGGCSALKKPQVTKQPDHQYETNRWPGMEASAGGISQRSTGDIQGGGSQRGEDQEKGVWRGAEGHQPPFWHISTADEVSSVYIHTIYTDIDIWPDPTWITGDSNADLHLSPRSTRWGVLGWCPGEFYWFWEFLFSLTEATCWVFKLTITIKLLSIKFQLLHLMTSLSGKLWWANPSQPCWVKIKIRTPSYGSSETH